MTVANIQWPNAGLTNDDIAPQAGIQASKLERYPAATEELFAAATTVVALASRMLATIRGATGTVIGFESAIVTKATGADRTIAVDLQKSTGGGAFASICSVTCNFTNSSANLTPVAAVLSSTTLVDGDILRAVVTVAGSAGAQALGLHCTLHWKEDP